MRQIAEQHQYFCTITNIAAGEFADNKRVGLDGCIMKQRGKQMAPAAQVIDPDIGVDENH